MELAAELAATLVFLAVGYSAVRLLWDDELPNWLG